MRDLLSRHAPKIGFSNAVLILFFLAFGSFVLSRHTSLISLLASSATTSDNTAPVTLYFTPYNPGNLLVGETTEVDVSINARSSINAVGATITFPPESIEVIGISKAKSFLNLWTEDTVIKESEGRITFSGGTTEIGGMHRIATLVTLTLRAKAPGEARLQFLDPLILAADGMGSKVESETRTFSYTITVPPKPITQTANNVQGSPTHQLAQLDFNEDGVVSIADASILLFKLIGGYDARYDLDHNGSLGLTDLSIFFSEPHEQSLRRVR